MGSPMIIREHRSLHLFTTIVRRQFGEDHFDDGIPEITLLYWLIEGSIQCMDLTLRFFLGECAIDRDRMEAEFPCQSIDVRLTARRTAEGPDGFF